MYVYTRLHSPGCSHFLWLLFSIKGRLCYIYIMIGVVVVVGGGVCVWGGGGYMYIRGVYCYWG